MNFLLTLYIHPLEKQIPLSKVLNISFDNPRTEEEISYISRYLKVSLDSPNQMYSYGPPSRLPMAVKKGFLSIKSAFKQFYKEHKKSDPYVKSFFKANSQKNGFEFLAKMWIIARFDDEGAFKKLQDESKDLHERDERNWIRFLDSEHPIYKNSDKLVDYSYLLSTLLRPINDESAINFSYLLHTDIDELREPKIDKRLNATITYWVMGLFPYKDKETDQNWRFYINIKEKIRLVADSVDVILDERSIDNLLYIGSLLKIAAEKIEDDRIRLVTLVTIIETILTRNPDTSRFNVEDSISKQFKLKAGLLIYLNNKSLNLSSLKKNLTEIYSQRSNIAHGNLAAFNTFIEKKAKSIKGETYIYTPKEIAISEFLSEIFGYVKSIIEEYIKDRNFVDFIKEN